MRARAEQQAEVISHYRRSVVPQLRSDAARVASENHSLTWRLRHAEKELSMKDGHIALLERQRRELRGQLDAGKIDVPSFVLSMRQTLAQLETNLAQSHEERCKLFSDISMLKTEKSLVVRELRDTERRVEGLQQEADQQKTAYERHIGQLAEKMAHAQSRASLLTDQLRQQEAQSRLERQNSAQEVAAMQEENAGLREQIDNLFGILAKKDETAYKLCSKLLTLKESRDRKDTEVLDTMSKYQTVIGKVLDQLNDVNMENLLLVSNRLQHSQPQQYKMLLESLKFKIFLETENAGMTQECHRLRYENTFLQRENQRILEQLQDIQLRLLPQELRDEHVVLREGRLSRVRHSSGTQTEPFAPGQRHAESTAADGVTPQQAEVVTTSPDTSPSPSNVSVCSLPESQQDIPPRKSANQQQVKRRSRSPPPSPGSRPRRASRRGRESRGRGVTWGQLLEGEPCADERLDPTALTQMMQLAVAQSCELEELDDSLQLSTD